MASSNKKRQLTATEMTNADYDKAMNELADVIIESLKEGYNSDLEPFEVYAQKIRSQIHHNLTDFRGRFAKGYRTLVEELATHQPPPSGEGEGPNVIRP